MVRSTLPVLVCLLALCFSDVNAQDKPVACKSNKTAPPMSSYHWPADSEVKVYFVRGVFTAEQQTRLIAAMEIWTNAATAAGANVKFIYAGEVQSGTSCAGCLTVGRREIYKFERKHYAYFYPLALENSRLLSTGMIAFDFATTNPRALQAFMSHELGHGMGLWDCPSCKNKVTIMGSAPGINRDNGLIDPSPCDREIVRRVYAAERSLARNAQDDQRRRQSVVSE